MTENGVLIGTLWCPIVEKMNKYVSLSMEDKGKGLRDLKQQVMKPLARVKDDCPQSARNKVAMDGNKYKKFFFF